MYLKLPHRYVVQSSKKSSGSSYKGYPSTHSDGTAYVSLPSIILISYDKDITMWFHIYGLTGKYDATSDYVCCPYHDKISSIGSKYTGDNITEFVRQYLNLIVPVGSGDASIDSIQSSPSQSASTTNYISVIRSTVITRFDVQLKDILKEIDLVSSSYVESLTDISTIGHWFIDHDKTINSKTYEPKTVSLDGEMMTFRARRNSTFYMKMVSGSGKLHIIKNASNIVEQISHIDMFQSGTYRTVEDVVSTIDVDSNRITHSLPADSLFSVNLLTNDIAIITSKNIKFTTFELEPCSD